MTDSPSRSAPAGPGPRARVALAVAAAVDSVDGARRTAGFGVEVATQYRSGRIIGVRLREDRIEVHIVAERPDVIIVVDEVHRATRRALEELGDHRRVAVTVDDLDLASLAAGGGR